VKGSGPGFEPATGWVWSRGRMAATLLFCPQFYLGWSLRPLLERSLVYYVIVKLCSARSLEALFLNMLT